MWANTPVQRMRARSIQPPQGSILKATLSRAPLHHIVYAEPATASGLRRGLLVLDGSPDLLNQLRGRLKPVLFGVNPGLLEHVILGLAADHVIAFRAGVDLVAIDNFAHERLLSTRLWVGNEGQLQAPRASVKPEVFYIGRYGKSRLDRGFNSIIWLFLA